ncbi:hypothetical protein D3C78_912500 [compost metagenome]
MRGGIHRQISGVLEGKGRLDLPGLRRGGGEEYEVDVLAPCRLGLDRAAEGVAHALGAGFAVAQLEQVGDLLGQAHRLVDVLGGDQAAAASGPVLAEGGQHAVAPLATRYQSHGTAHAVVPGALGYGAGFVLGGEAELEQLGGAFAAILAIVEGKGGQRQLFALLELVDQRFFQGADHQLHAFGLRLAIEGVQVGQLAAVMQADAQLAATLALVVRGEEAVAQRLCDAGELPLLWQQQGDVGQRAGGHLLQLDQRLGQLAGCRMLRVLRLPFADARDLLGWRGVAARQAPQLQPAGQVVAGCCGAVQLAARQCRHQSPDCFMVAGGGLALQQRGDEHALAGSRQRLFVGLQGFGAGQLAANLLVDRQFAQAREARVLQGAQGGLRLVARQCQLGAQCAGEDLLGGLQFVETHQLQDLLGLGQLALAQCLVGGGEAQQGGLLRLALLGLLQQLLGAGLGFDR